MFVCFFHVVREDYTWDQYLKFAKGNISKATSMWKASTIAPVSIDTQIRCLQKALAAETERAEQAEKRTLTLEAATSDERWCEKRIYYFCVQATCLASPHDVGLT